MFAIHKYFFLVILVCHLVERTLGYSYSSKTIVSETRLRLVQSSPDDVTEASCCRRSRSWRCHSSASGCDRRLFCCSSLCSWTFHGSLGCQESGRFDNIDTRVRSCFLPELLRPTTRIAPHPTASETPCFCDDVCCQCGTTFLYTNVNHASRRHLPAQWRV
uniref:Putative secreted protein n=1 Tax=Ixodes ricinus TaxID=34613 RepID=A0A6B0UWQ2_IXORI